MWVILFTIIIGVLSYFGFNYWQEQKEFAEHSKTYNLTLEELRKFDGVKSKRTFICVKGDIFDVSNSSFYTPGGSYSIFAGRESTVSLAKGSLDETYLDQLNVPLSPDEEEALDSFYIKFCEKYRKVGKLVVKDN